MVTMMLFLYIRKWLFFTCLLWCGRQCKLFVQALQRKLSMRALQRKPCKLPVSVLQRKLCKLPVSALQRKPCKLPVSALQRKPCKLSLSALQRKPCKLPVRILLLLSNNLSVSTDVCQLPRRSLKPAVQLSYCHRIKPSQYILHFLMRTACLKKSTIFQFTFHVWKSLYAFTVHSIKMSLQLSDWDLLLPHFKWEDGCRVGLSGNTC